MSVGQEPQDEPERPRREPIFNIPAAIMVTVGLCAVIHFVRVWVLSTDQDIALLVRAAFIPLRYSGRFALDVYAFTSPVTYSVLHGSFTHLAVNMVWLAAVGVPLANRIGVLRFSLFWLVTAVAAAGAHYLVHPLDNAPLVGASGAISGMMAASVRYALRVDRHSSRPGYAGRILPIGAALRSRQVLVFTSVWMIGNLLVGLLGSPGVSQSIAWEAHIGGFIAGFLLVGWFDRPVDDMEPARGEMAEPE